METLPIFVLMETHSETGGKETRRNADVTFDLAEAEAWAAQAPKPTDSGYIEYSFDNFEKPCDLVVLGAETTVFLREMREFKDNVAPIQQLIADGILRGADDAV